MLLHMVDFAKQNAENTNINNIRLRGFSFRSQKKMVLDLFQSNVIPGPSDHEFNFKDIKSILFIFVGTPCFGS